MSLADDIRAGLARLEPTQLDLVDDSARHAGHAGSRDGGSHFNLRIVSNHFNGLSKVARHRMVYDALGSLMHRQVHALSIIALSPTETQDQDQ
jgi:BolA protein